jgi:hypothetical protein
LCGPSGYRGAPPRPPQPTASATSTSARTSSTSWSTSRGQLDRRGLVIGVRADLHLAHLWSAQLDYANLTSAFLGDANLTYAHLGGAKLNGAYLDSADLTGTDLTATHFDNAFCLAFVDDPQNHVAGGQGRAGVVLAGSGPLGWDYCVVVIWVLPPARQRGHCAGPAAAL